MLKAAVAAVEVDTPDIAKMLRNAVQTPAGLHCRQLTETQPAINDTPIMPEGGYITA